MKEPSYPKFEPMNKKLINETYYIKQCVNESCRFRYPAPKDSGIGVFCPKCKSETVVIHEIPLSTERSQIDQVNNSRRLNCEVLLDNIRSTFNVGAIFRSADGVGIKKIHLCGITPSPANTKVHKTALGAEDKIPYETYYNALDLAKELKNNGYTLWAIEKTDISQSILDFKISVESKPTLLIMGNEITGVDPDLLKICDLHLHIPMVGLKNSLNVAIAFGIAVYSLTAQYFLEINDNAPRG